MGAQERQSGGARPNAELPGREVDRTLVALKVVEAEDELRAVPLVEHGDRGGDEGGADVQRAGVDSADDLRAADTDGDAGEALVNEAHDAALLGAACRHDRRLHA